jgi:hypothetical protein
MQRDHKELLVSVIVKKKLLLIKNGYRDSSRPSVAQNDTYWDSWRPSVAQNDT